MKKKKTNWTNKTSYKALFFYVLGALFCYDSKRKKNTTISFDISDVCEAIDRITKKFQGMDGYLWLYIIMENISNARSPCVM